MGMHARVRRVGAVRFTARLVVQEAGKSGDVRCGPPTAPVLAALLINTSRWPKKKAEALAAAGEMVEGSERSQVWVVQSGEG